MFTLKASLIVFVGCERAWTQDPSTNRFCYIFISSKLNWDDARSYCQKLEGELASVTSSETNDFLTTLTQEKCWIGGYTEDRDTWQWSDGSPWGYTNWANGEPNNKGGNQDKLQKLSRWDDVQSDDKRPFICQKQSGIYVLEF